MTLKLVKFLIKATLYFIFTTKFFMVKKKRAYFPLGQLTVIGRKSTLSLITKVNTLLSPVEQYIDFNGDLFQVNSLRD